MPSNNPRLRAVAVIGALGAALTTLFFFLAVAEPTKGQMAGFGVLLGVEALVIAGLFWIESSFGHISGVIFRSGAYTSFLAYLVIAGLTALVVIFQAGDSLKWLLILETAWLGLLAVTLTLLFASSASTARIDRELYDRGSRSRQLAGRLASLAARAAGASWGAPLVQLAEELKFADHVSSTSIEALLAEEINALEILLEDQESGRDERAAKAEESLGRLKNLVEKRAAEAGLQKRGGF